MVANGNEGYRAYGPYDPLAPLTYPFLNWMNSGLKGARDGLGFRMRDRLVLELPQP